MQKKVAFQLEDAVEVPNWASAYPEHKFTVYRCCFLSTKENSHHIPITKKILMENAASILGTWLVAKIEWGDSTTHRKDEQIYGYFPMEQEIEFLEDDDGILKAYAYAVVSKRYSKEFNGIFEFDNLRNSSVEMTVSYSDPEDENSVDGFDIEALTCLGKTVNGSCPDADIKMVRFSEKEAESFFKKNNSIKLFQFVQERKNQMAEKSYKIDKSKESISTKPWGEVDKTELRNKIMEASNKSSLVKEVYMLVEDGWEDAPSEHLKYPVMCFEGDKLVYNRYGLASALAYAKQENEKSVINKIEAIYKKLDLDDDSNGKEEKNMSEIEFSAVNIGDMWGLLYSAMKDRREWNYYIKGIYEQDNKKFAIVYDGDMKLYRLDFSLTEEGITLADEIIEVKEEFIETDNIKKFAEPEDVEKYRLCEENKEEEAKDAEMAEEKAEMSLEDMEEKMAKLEKDIEDKDNIIMERDNDIEKMTKELEELRKFKEDIEEKQKAQNVESILEEVKNYMSDEQLSTFRKEGLACEMSELDSWSNKVKAVSFEVAKNVKSKKNDNDVWSFSAPISTSKKNGLWD